jgi:hypothetical protein
MRHRGTGIVPLLHERPQSLVENTLAGRCLGSR